MITAQQARDLMATESNIVAKLTEIESVVSSAANSGLFSVEVSIEDSVLAIRLVNILIGLGYVAHHESQRSILKIRW